MNENPQNLSEFGEMYDEFFSKIYNFVFYRTQDKNTSEEVTSQTFLKAAQKFHTFRPGKGSFQGWLYRIARNSLTDFYRSKKQHVDLEAAFSVSSSEDIEKEVSIKLDFEKFKEALSILKPEAKEIIIMRLWDGLSFKEIAEIIGKSEANCKMILSRSVKKLQEHITVLTFILSFIFLIK